MNRFKHVNTNQNRTPGFTLAELLIALAILGIIAVFTIPKVLMAQQAQQSNAIAKETAAMIGQAYQAYQMDNPVTAATHARDLTPYMNYVAIDTTTTLDELPNYGVTSSCGNAICLVLHNGARLRTSNVAFNGTNTTNAVWFMLDPDGKYGGGGIADYPSKPVFFMVYTTGKIRTFATLEPNTQSSDIGRNPTTSYDPSWFSWN